MLHGHQEVMYSTLERLCGLKELSVKYIDDSEVIVKVTCEEDVDKVQNILSVVYNWERKNNMLWNSEKFMKLSIGNEIIRINTIYFTPNYDEPIKSMAENKDLGIINVIGTLDKENQIRAMKAQT